MSKFFDRLFTVIDKTAEAGARKTAMQTGRRSFLAKAGVALAGTMAMPLLPFDRSLGGLAMAATGAVETSMTNTAVTTGATAPWTATCAAPPAAP